MRRAVFLDVTPCHLADIYSVYVKDYCSLTDGYCNMKMAAFNVPRFPTEINLRDSGTRNQNSRTFPKS
jgi:hypothetical protein